jgi:hypothetical protein
MNIAHKRQLVARAIDYYSTNDEMSFFYWLEKIPCIAGYHGEGIDLLIDLNDTVDDESLRELIALFFRYNIDLSQLAVLATESNGAWFKNPQAYWYESVFSSRLNEISVSVEDSDKSAAVLLTAESDALAWLAREIEERRIFHLSSRESTFGLGFFPTRGEGELYRSFLGCEWSISAGEAVLVSRQLREFVADPSIDHVYLLSANNKDNIRIKVSKA